MSAKLTLLAFTAFSPHTNSPSYPPPRTGPALTMTKLRTPYDFARGHPNPSLLPVEEMREIMLSIATGDDIGPAPEQRQVEEEVDDENDVTTLCLNYGHEAGSPELLAELGSFLARHTAGDDLGRSSSSDEGQGSISSGSLAGDGGDVGGGKPPSRRQNDFFITNGVSHGIELLCATQTEPGDTVLVERPTYFLVADIFRAHGLKVRGVPMLSPEDNGGGGGAGGIDVEALIEQVESGTLEPVPRMMYFVPTHQNPTGHTMPVEDRRMLASFARKHGIILVADEVYHLLDWRDEAVHGRRPARMSAFNDFDNDDVDDDRQRPSRARNAGCCVSVSAFSKIFSPGVRCGWIEAPPHIISSLVLYGYIQSQGGLAPFMADLILCRALKTGAADRFLAKLRAAYADRAGRLCDVLEKDGRIALPNGRPLGGYFAWVRFPPDVDAEDFLTFCQEDGEVEAGGMGGVLFRPGSRCDPFFGDDGLDGEEGERNDAISGVTSESFRSCARLCFADLDDTDLIEGGRRLVGAFRLYMEKRCGAS